MSQGVETKNVISRSIRSALYETVVNRFLWVFLIVSILAVALFPPTVKLLATDWEDGSPDPYGSYMADAASLALGGKIYMTNHPGTPIHECYGWTLTVLRWVLFPSSSYSHAESLKAMREWLVLYPQTYLYPLQLFRVLAYLGLLLSLLLISQGLFGNRWIGFFAVMTLAGSDLIPKMITLHTIETFLLFTFPISAYYAIRFLEQPSFPDATAAAFWIALMLSFKIHNLPFAVAFLTHVLLFAETKEGLFTETARKRIGQMAFAALPALLAALAIAILILKSAKLPPNGIHKLIAGTVCLLAEIGCYLKWSRYRRWLLERPFFGFSLLGIAIFFVVLNIRMAWSAWIGFFLYDTFMGFEWNRLVRIWDLIRPSPLRLWEFWLGMAGWAICLMGWKHLKKGYGRAAIILFIPMSVPLYLLLFSTYEPHLNYMMILDTLGVLLAFSILALPFYFRPKSNVSSYQKALCAALCVSVLYPLATGQLAFTPGRMFENARHALVSLDTAFPTYFHQGRDAKAFYARRANSFLDFCNHYSSFRYPTEPSRSAAERQQREKQFQKIYSLDSR